MVDQIEQLAPTLSRAERMVHLVLIDVLAVVVGLRNGQRTEMHVRTMERVIQDRRAAGGGAL